MCGIAGFIGTSKLFSPEESEAVIKRMMARIIHRGPDGNGIYLDSDIGLGSVRLSIIDIAGGNQPISNEDDTLWIIYNGEIFNYLELRDLLTKRGHKFKTHTDTEVILHLYEEYGTEALKHLNGQFAFAIWDTKKEECFFARDRIGIRPLFYTLFNKTLIFGSEIKSILEFPGVKRQLSPPALKEVFTFWTTLTPNTCFENIYEIPPGHYALYKKNGNMEIQQFWSLKFPRISETYSRSVSDALEELNYLLSDSLVLQLRSDVQVGAYLSGGLDSSTITSFIKKFEPGVLNTFSIGFDNRFFDETKFQTEVSRHFDTKHKAISISGEDIAELFPRVIWHSEIPLLRTAPAPMMALSRFVQEQGFKVIITGEGADEAFSGYDIFKEALIRRFWARQPKSRLRPLLFKKIYPYVPSLASANAEVLGMFFKYKLEETDSPVYSHLPRWNNTSNIQNHFSEEIKELISHYNPVDQYIQKISAELEGTSLLAKSQFIETNIFLSTYLLSSQGDRMSMANSIEGRYPFLDYRILEFAASLPDEFKLKGMNEKFLLKELMKNELPNSVLKRPKQAYRSPISEAFKGPKMPEYVFELLSPGALKNFGIFNPEAVKNLINKINLSKNPSEIDQMAFIGILSTQLLYNLFIKNFAPIKGTDVLKIAKMVKANKNELEIIN